jgi:hypothetical protein
MPAPLRHGLSGGHVGPRGSGDLSLGVSGLDRDTPMAEHMREEVDFALYEVKGAGRDGVAVRGSQVPVPENHPSVEPAPTL